MITRKPSANPKGCGTNARSRPLWLVGVNAFRRFESPTIAARELKIDPSAIFNARIAATKKGSAFFDILEYRFSLVEPTEYRPVKKPAAKAEPKPAVAEQAPDPYKPEAPQRRPSKLRGACTHRLGTHNGGRW